MYGFCRDGSRPNPLAGVPPAVEANGGDTNAAIAEKNTMIPPSTAVTHGISSRLRCRLVSMTTVAAPPSTVSHSSREPGWLAQNALSTYPMGSDRLVVSATMPIEKSWRASAISSAAAATRVAPNDAITALDALAVSRRSRRRPANGAASVA